MVKFVFLLQFAEVCRVWENAKWPSEPVMNPVYSVEPFYEGAFLNMIFLRLSKLLHQVRSGAGGHDFA